MANDRLTEAYRCGQLFAALAALERLSEGPHHSLGKPGVRRQLSTEPRKHLTGICGRRAGIWPARPTGTRGPPPR
ncbi:hypothetical protein [Streptomyces anulatus]|uniref:hypothetical protein n=1 Tax=Streptomyces anulatus TaxID=1892 RepID=UPI003866CCE7|nr:hypothetical protein OG575_26830 [Streptomyces anulatus]